MNETKSINTYPKMNETIKDILRMSKDPFKQYTLQRIVELEAQVEQQSNQIGMVKDSLLSIHDVICTALAHGESLDISNLGSEIERIYKVLDGDSK